jgi:hypothetical protein
VTLPETFGAGGAVGDAAGDPIVSASPVDADSDAGICGRSTTAAGTGAGVGVVVLGGGGAGTGASRRGGAVVSLLAANLARGSADAGGDVGVPSGARSSCG